MTNYQIAYKILEDHYNDARNKNWNCFICAIKVNENDMKRLYQEWLGKNVMLIYENLKNWPEDMITVWRVVGEW